MGEEEEELSIREESRHTEAEMWGWGGATSAILPGLPIIGDVTMKRAPAVNSDSILSLYSGLLSITEYSEAVGLCPHTQEGNPERGVSYFVSL
jgi:hypothetical protein